jgi:hypothetical protein
LCSVDDTVDGILALAASPHSGPVNIGSDSEMTIIQIAAMILAVVRACSRRARTASGSSFVSSRYALPASWSGRSPGAASARIVSASAACSPDRNRGRGLPGAVRRRAGRRGPGGRGGVFRRAGGRGRDVPHPNYAPGQAPSQVS